MKRLPLGGGGVGGLGSSGAGASAASADVKQAFVLLLAAYNEQSDSIKYNPAMHLTALCPLCWEFKGLTMLSHGKFPSS